MKLARAGTPHKGPRTTSAGPNEKPYAPFTLKHLRVSTQGWFLMAFRPPHLRADCSRPSLRIHAAGPAGHTPSPRDSPYFRDRERLRSDRGDARATPLTGGVLPLPAAGPEPASHPGRALLLGPRRRVAVHRHRPLLRRLPRRRRIQPPRQSTAAVGARPGAPCGAPFGHHPPVRRRPVPALLTLQNEILGFIGPSPEHEARQYFTELTLLAGTSTSTGSKRPTTIPATERSSRCSTPMPSSRLRRSMAVHDSKGARGDGGR